MVFSISGLIVDVPWARTLDRPPSPDQSRWTDKFNIVADVYGHCLFCVVTVLYNLAIANSIGGCGVSLWAAESYTVQQTHIEQKHGRYEVAERSSPRVEAS